MQISASILGANILKIGDNLEQAINAGIDRIHVDIMDGNYVENISFGSQIIEAIKKNSITKPIDVHLMTRCTKQLVQQCIMLDVSSISIHPKTIRDPLDLIAKIQAANIKAGIAINPDEAVTDFKDLLRIADEVLLMSVTPGACGQRFKAEVLQKVSDIRKLSNAKITIDGGIKPGICQEIASYSIECIVAGSAIFAGDIKSNVWEFAQQCK